MLSTSSLYRVKQKEGQEEIQLNYIISEKDENGELIFSFGKYFASSNETILFIVENKPSLYDLGYDCIQLYGMKVIYKNIFCLLMWVDEGVDNPEDIFDFEELSN